MVNYKLSTLLLRFFRESLVDSTTTQEGNGDKKASPNVNGERNYQNRGPPVDLRGCGLSKTQEAHVRQLLWEKSAVFSKDDNDICCIPDLELNICFIDDTPIQGSFISIPRALYDKVKDYLRELGIKGWIRKSLFKPYLLEKEGWFTMLVLRLSQIKC